MPRLELSVIPREDVLWRDPRPPVGGAVIRPVQRLDGESSHPDEDLVVEEFPLTVFQNDEEVVTMLCSPGDERNLVLGFLASEGLIATPDDVRSIDIDMTNGLAWVESAPPPQRDPQAFLKRCLVSCCGRGRAGLHFANDSRLVHVVESPVRLTPEDIRQHAQALEDMSRTYRLTGGVHNGALSQDGRQLCFSQDIGRHNVLDKLYGFCLGAGLAMRDMVLTFSGRVSSEIVLKVSKMNVPVVIARKAPTSLALDLARDLGVTVVGFARGEDCNVYTHAERVTV